VGEHKDIIYMTKPAESKFEDDHWLVLGTDRNDTGRLRFNSADDARDFAKRGTEELKRRLARLGGSLPHRYCNGDVELKLTFRGLLKPHVCQLLLRGVPFGQDGMEMDFFDVSRTDTNALASQNVGRESAVDFSIPDLVEIGQDRVPAFVRLEIDEEFAEAVGDLAVFALQVSFNIFLRLPEGKLRVFRRSVSGHDNDSIVNCMIETRAQSIDDFKCVDRQVVWDFLSDSDLAINKARVGVVIVDQGVGVFAHKGLGAGFELIDVVICSSQ